MSLHLSACKQPRSLLIWLFRSIYNTTITYTCKVRIKYSNITYKNWHNWHNLKVLFSKLLYTFIFIFLLAIYASPNTRTFTRKPFLTFRRSVQRVSSIIIAIKKNWSGPFSSERTTSRNYRTRSLQWCVLFVPWSSYPLSCDAV